MTGSVPATKSQDEGSGGLADLLAYYGHPVDNPSVRVTLTKEHMPSLTPYIPPKNAALVAWGLNFSTLITASPGTYGLVSGDAVAIAAQYTTLAAAYALITSSATKTAATVAAFNADKINALALWRPYAQAISLNAGVSSSNKIALGVNPRTSVPLPITTPTTNPVLTAQSASTGGIIVRYRDATASPSVKSKPYGVIGTFMYAKASLTVITDPDMLVFQGTETKSPFTLSMPGTAGMVVYVAARWVTKKGLVGPWSPIISYGSVQA